MPKCSNFRYIIASSSQGNDLAKESGGVICLSCSHDVGRVSNHVLPHSPLLEEQAVRTGRFATKPSVEAADRRERTAARKADFMVSWRCSV